MLDLVFGLVLATAGLTAPGLADQGLDRRIPEVAQTAAVPRADRPGDAAPAGRPE